MVSCLGCASKILCLKSKFGAFQKDCALERFWLGTAAHASGLQGFEDIKAMHCLLNIATFEIVFAAGREAILDGGQIECADLSAVDRRHHLGNLTREAIKEFTYACAEIGRDFFTLPRQTTELAGILEELELRAKQFLAAHHCAGSPENLCKETGNSYRGIIAHRGDHRCDSRIDTFESAVLFAQCHERLCEVSKEQSLFRIAGIEVQVRDVFG